MSNTLSEEKIKQIEADANYEFDNHYSNARPQFEIPFIRGYRVAAYKYAEQEQIKDNIITKQLKQIAELTEKLEEATDAIKHFTSIE